MMMVTGLQRAQVEARLQMLSAGRYTLDGVYKIERTPDGWRWSKEADAGTGGEWRRSKREAVLDLTHYLNQKGDA